MTMIENAIEAVDQFKVTGINCFDLMKSIRELQATISFGQNELLERAKLFVQSNGEADDEFFVRLDNLIVMCRRLASAQLRIERLLKTIRRLKCELQQGRVMYSTQLMEHARLFKRLLDFSERGEDVISETYKLLSSMENVTRLTIVIQS